MQPIFNIFLGENDVYNRFGYYKYKTTTFLINHNSYFIINNKRGIPNKACAQSHCWLGYEIDWIGSERHK